MKDLFQNLFLDWIPFVEAETRSTSLTLLTPITIVSELLSSLGSSLGDALVIEKNGRVIFANSQAFQLFQNWEQSFLFENPLQSNVPKAEHYKWNLCFGETVASVENTAVFTIKDGHTSVECTVTRLPAKDSELIELGWRIFLLVPVGNADTSKNCEADHVKKQIAERLHDEVGQLLTGLTLSTQALRQQYAREEALYEGLGKNLQLLRQIHEEVRGLCDGSFQPDFTRMRGFLNALKEWAVEYARLCEVKITIEEMVEPDWMSEDQKAILHSIAKEAIVNAIRHSGSKKICVSSVLEGSRYRLKVVDHGNGFSDEDSDIKGQTVGLALMSQRALMLGGRVLLSNDPLSGGVVSIELNQSSVYEINSD